MFASHCSETYLLPPCLTPTDTMAAMPVGVPSLFVLGWRNPTNPMHVHQLHMPQHRRLLPGLRQSNFGSGNFWPVEVTYEPLHDILFHFFDLQWQVTDIRPLARPSRVPLGMPTTSEPSGATFSGAARPSRSLRSLVSKRPLECHAPTAWPS